LLLVLLPCTPGDISAHNCFHREDLQFLDDHAATFELALEGLNRIRKRVERSRDEVIRTYGPQVREPEFRECSEKLSLVRDPLKSGISIFFGPDSIANGGLYILHHNVVGRDSVCRNEEEGVIR
jgi:hypothetical protein